jgi:hypothetical protein
MKLCEEAVMVDQRDVNALRQVRTELTKRGVDIGRADLQMRNGVLTMRGSVGGMPGVAIPDLKLEVEHIARLLRQKPDIRDVIVDLRYV